MAVKASATITLNSVVDIKATYRYYLLQSSTASKPAKPTTNPPGGSWTDAEPTYTSGSTNSLYFVDLTVFSDDKFSYSNVSLSTAYEASKEAYNKAVNAQNSVNNLEIGGRNLLLDSDKEVTRSVGSSGAEFVQYADIAPIFDTYGLIEYTISFDIKSADVSKNSRIRVYCQNGSGAKHSIGEKYITVTTEYVRHYYTFTPTVQSQSETRSMLAFYGEYETGNIPFVKNIKIEKGNKATDWTPAPEDVDDAIDSANNKADQLMEWKGGAQTDMQKLKDVIYFLAVGEHGEATEFSQFADGFSFSFAKTNQDIKDTNDELKIATDDIETLRKFMNENKDYINFTTIDDGNGGTEPCIELGVKGNTAGSKFKIRITNTRIMFMEDADIPTYISNKTLITEKVEVEQELAQSGFVWKVRSNGNYGLSWKGV